MFFSLSNNSFKYIISSNTYRVVSIPKIYYFPLHCIEKMVGLDNKKVTEQNVEIQNLLGNVKSQINTLTTQSVQMYKSKLMEENLSLKKEIEELQNVLSKYESVSLEGTTKSTNSIEAPVEAPKVSTPKPKDKEVKTPKQPKSEPSGDASAVDVGRLDFRIGKILSAEKHPDADSLYVEKIDVGEADPRTVVSGLVRHITAAELEGLMVVLLCNLKPAKMRGVTSQAMVMCASTPEKVEVLTPPPGCVPGDLVEFEGYERNPDAVLNPKKKIFETLAPDLRTDDSNVANYKNVPFTVKGKDGKIVAKTLKNVQVK